MVEEPRQSKRDWRDEQLLGPPCFHDEQGGETYRSEAPNGALQSLGKWRLKKTRSRGVADSLPRSRKRTNEIKKAGSPSSVDGGSGRG